MIILALVGSKILVEQKIITYTENVSPEPKKLGPCLLFIL